MKTRWTAAVLCCLLLFSLAGPARAAGTVYFVAVEESVLPVTDETMPFWANGYLYVSVSAFTDLGISIINNTGKKITILEKDRRALLFNWESGTAQDSSGSSIYPGAIQSGGTVFVPASTVADFFGALYSVVDVAHGHLVWLRSSNFGMKARDFANAATYNMEERYTAYTSRSEQTAPDPAPAPETGTIVPSRSRIHLCLEADQRTSGLLDALDRASGWATFYCTPAFLEENGDLLRRMTVSGHSIGILLENRGEISEQLVRGQEALYRAALSQTRLVYLPDADEAALQSLREQGLCPLSPTLNRAGYRLESAANAKSLLERVSGQRRSVSVWLGTTASAAGLREFVLSAHQAGHYCRGITETD